MRMRTAIIFLLAGVSAAAVGSCGLEDAALFLPSRYQAKAHRFSTRVCLLRNSDRASESCLSRCGTVNAVFRQCSCHPSCVRLGNCCYDYERTCATNEEKAEVRRAIENRQRVDPYACLQPSIPQGVTLETGYRLINKCVSQYNGPCSVQDLCHQPPNPLDSYTDAQKLAKEHLPVLASDGRMYKNVYCAICNNQHINDYWTVQVSCSTDLKNSTSSDILLSLHKLARSSQCSVKLLIPGSVPGNKISYHGCSYGLIDSCPLGSTWMSRFLCASFLHPIKAASGRVNGREIRYKNIYCAKCNGVSERAFSSDACVFPRLPAAREVGFSFTRLVSIDALTGGQGSESAVVDYEI